MICRIIPTQEPSIEVNRYNVACRAYNKLKEDLSHGWEYQGNAKIEDLIEKYKNQILKWEEEHPEYFI